MDGWEIPGFQRMLELVRRAQEQQRQFDEATRVSRQMEEATRGFRQMEEATRGFRQVHEAMKASRLVDQLRSADHLREWDRLLSVQRAIEEVHRLQRSPLEETVAQQARQLDRILRLSVRPFPDIITISRSPLEREFLDAYNHLNLGLAKAALLAEVELENKEADEEREAVDVESQLIEVVPPEALDSLRRVRFVPFSLLSKVVAHPRTLFEITPRTFEEFVAELVFRLGIDDVLLTPERADGGRDVIGTKRVLGIPLILAFECKRYAPDNPVSVETARALLGTITHSDYRADRGVLVTTSRFTAPARQFILTSPLLESRDFDGIVDWLGEFAKLQQGRAD